MKMRSHITFTMAGGLLALFASAQEGPIRIQLPPNSFPDEEFPVPPDMPPEGWGEPGFGGEMFMPPMPGRFQVISAQIQQAGKSVPIVLKIDTQTGEVWQLKVSTVQRFHNGRPKTETHMVFEPLGRDREPRHDQSRGNAPRRPNIDRVRPNVDTEPGRRNLIEPETEPETAPRPRR